MTAASPGVISVMLSNSYYPTREAYVFALADIMRREYEAIADAGFVVQIDCPDLAMSHNSEFSDLSIAEFKKVIGMHVDALNHATANIAPDRMRMHLCWGNYQGPHNHDIALHEILPTVLRARPGALSFEAAVRLAARIGLLRTMVFTHLPSNVLLAAIAFAPDLPTAVALMLARSLLSQMDVPIRQAYVTAIVERSEPLLDRRGALTHARGPPPNRRDRSQRWMQRRALREERVSIEDDGRESRGFAKERLVEKGERSLGRERHEPRALEPGQIR